MVTANGVFTPTLRKRNNRYQVQVRRKGYPDISKPLLKLKDANLRHSIFKRPLFIISTVDFAKYRDERLKDITAKSLKRNLSAINNMFQVARDKWGIPIKENPLEKMKPNDNKRERRLQEGEYEKLIQAAQTRKNPLVEI